MRDGTADLVLTEQLLMIARDPDLRQSVYARLGEYCHQCRNRLNSLKLSLFLAIRQSPAVRTVVWDEIDRCYQDLEQRVERLQLICRPLTLSPVPIALDLLVADRRSGWSNRMAEAGCELDLVAPKDRSIASYDVPSMGMALDALVAWRAGEVGKGCSARVRWWVDVHGAHFVWEESRAEPGPRGDSPEAGAAWTLPLMARIVLAHGGEYHVEDGPTWRLAISWPSHPPTS